MRIPLDWFQRSMLAVAAGIMIFQLAVPPIAGLADNGDWPKIMHPAGFRHVSETPDLALFLSPKVEFAEPGWDGAYPRYLVSGRLIAKAARLIGPIFSRDGLFDLRVLGLLHASLLLVSLALVMAATFAQPAITRRLIAALLVLIFTDVGYVAFCNSFYSQTASLIFLVMTAGFFAMTLSARTREWMWYGGFALSATLFATSKPQEAPQIILLATLAAAIPRVLGMTRPFLLGASVSLCMIAITAVCGYGASREIHNPSFYHAFFHELLAASPDPKADLIAFGLNPELSRWAGSNAFQADSPARTPEFQKEFFEKVGYPDLYLFYLKHPARFWSLLGRRSEKAFTLITHYGNFDRSAGFAPGAQTSSFRLWSGLKMRAFPGSIWTLIAIFAASFTAVSLLWRKATPRYRLGLAGFATLNLMAIGAFVVCALSDGRLDIVRQLFAFNTMVDLMIVASVTGITQRYGGRREADADAALHVSATSAPLR
ncbi:MAG: hypothetical protein ABI882_13040 [Acidobacteriota bacterium]